MNIRREMRGFIMGSCLPGRQGLVGMLGIGAVMGIVSASVGPFSTV